MDNLLPWFCLKHVPGIGNHLFKRLIDRFNLPESVFQASRQQLLEVEGITERHLDAMRSYKAGKSLKAELDQIHQKGYKIITLTDRLYPPLLKEIPDPPPYLYVYGNLDGSFKNIAVVGSRHPTAYGVSITKNLCADLCALGIIIVSGMAVGIDTAAHRGALSGKGKTVAVLGSGFNKIYPAQNKTLFEQIAAQGAVISEFALDAEPEAHHFPIRNRIISGMSMGTVVVEASRRSGSLITAKLAAEQNREVFAVPGSIQSFKSTGTHALIKQGAKLVENAQDVVEELEAYLDTPAISADRARNDAHPELSTLTPEERVVYNMISPYPEHIDTIGRKAHIEAGTLLSVLLQLELKGMVQQLPGKFFALFEHKEKR
jgi:DNA processing protein